MANAKKLAESGLGKREGEGRINRAQENVHREHIDRSKLGGENRGSDVGNERHADLKRTQEGMSRDEGFEKPYLSSPLRGAVEELYKQHPHKHNDHGPHHGTTDHIRHEPLHGMRPHGRG